jgi:hypothetical protein
VKARGFRRWLEGLPEPLRGVGGLLLLVLAAGALAVAVLVVTGALDDPEVEPGRIFEAAVAGEEGEDPYAWEEYGRGVFARRARLGNSHVLYELSPGGVMATARRVTGFEDEIEAAADEHGVSAELMAAMVFLESAGRPEVIAGGSDPANASGLAQIVASTGIDLLGMDIDLARSRKLTRRISASLRRASELRARAARLAGRAERQRGERRRRRLQRRARRLGFEAREAKLKARIARRERARVDPRFDPVAALDGMGRYLEIAGERFGREDLATASYHMGIGNLTDVVRSYVSAEDAELALPDLIDQLDLSYAQLYFDSSPTRNPRTWRILSGFGDDSSTYYWRVLAALEIMRLWREDREELRRLARLHGNKATAEEVFHPESETRVFEDAGELRDALDSGELVPIPPGRRYGYRVGNQLGELSERLGVDRELYRALRPEALAALIYMTGRVQAISGRRHDLTITSAVRDRAYQEALVGRNVQATPNYSLHTTGYSFDVLRRYANDEQARAFQFALDRMKALGVIVYAREPQAIHVTVSPLAEELLN